MLLASVSPTAEAVGLGSWITNSTVSAVVAVALVVGFVQIATRRLALVPVGAQNFLEWTVESLFAVVEAIVGAKLVRKVAPLLVAYFIFILVANWSALLPGVGSVGVFEAHDGQRVFVPLLRGANADLNMTLALALSFMVIWFVWTIQEVGLWGFIKHNFGPKGLLETTGLGVVTKSLTVALNAFLAFIFVGVGCIELISIASRALSLPMRLYGNIFGGENLVHALMGLGGPVGGVVFGTLAYGMELLVGLVQALVFLLLCAVYTQLSTAHEEEAH
ncbi:MAG: F0F1 ATP synthase subunit A [Verrucomicrobiales bacterium]|jgi:F-type H+-transporting ATPase subunit a|nr:F0F1 ATP synthase subunit A [Verrucomicrobiales bacterium]